MDQKAQQFAAKLMATFKVEAGEHLKGISDGLLALEGNLEPQQRQELVETIFRYAHSLKGSARAVNHDAIQEICQSLENVLSDLRQDKIHLERPQFDILYETADLIGKLISDSNNRPKDFSSLLKDLTVKLNNLRLGQEACPEKPKPIPESKPTIQEASGNETSSVTTIRVSLPKLDRLMQEVEEMLILKLITTQRFRNLKEVQKHVHEQQNRWNRSQVELRKLRQTWEGEIKNYIPSKEFLIFLEQMSDRNKELDETLQTLSKNAGQDARLVGSMVDGLLEDAKKILMLPFSSVFEIFPRMVRDLSHSLNKNVSLILQGEDIEVDRRILEEMKDPLIHLMRNCIDHGIESPEVRQENQKSEEAHLILSATQTSGNTVEISISDDGKGIDVEKVKKAAISTGQLSEADVSALSEEEALKLIFKSGVSTSPIITELSGRGIGMGVVLEKVEKLGGAIRVETKQNVGTTFIISLPLTIATFRGLHIRVSEQDFIFPTHNLLRVLRITPDQIQTIEGKESISVNGRNLSYIHLSELLDIDKCSDETKKFIYILVIKVTETTFAVGIDAILNEQEVFIKSLGKQLARVRNIAAATIMEEGKIIPILDPFDLKKSIQAVRSRVSAAPVESEARKKSILIAEDSSTARLLLKNIFEGAGYNVRTAVNGADALTTIKSEIVDLLVSDVEMPRMDGFKLTEKLRTLDDYKDLPIVLCTSRGSQEDREHGIEVGANAYIDKSSFAQSNLLEIVRKLL
jgi:two-component system, chemotaxis family, sensor kinase CheA